MERARTFLCRVACATSMAFASLDVCASTLFHCVAQDGAVAYQDVPCGGDTVLTRTIPVTGEAGGGEAGAKKKAKQKASRKAKAGASGTQATASTAAASTATGSRSVRGERAKRRDACRAAREKREAALAQLGLRRTFEQLRQIDDRVHDACKGL